MTVKLTPPPASLGQTPEEKAWLAQLARIVGASVSSGTTAERPTAFLFEGRPYFDTDLVAGAGKPIYRNADNTGWVETIGTSEIVGLGILATPTTFTAACQGRLTLESGVGVSPTDQAAKTSVFYMPYVGELVPIYNGSVWTPTVFTQLTQVLDADSGHTGYHEAGKNFDLFVVNDAGTIRLGTGPAWTSDTGRGTGAGTTELQRLNGIWTNKVSMTLRWGSASGNTITVAANCGTFVGTMRASANGQTTWELGGAAAGGDPGKLFLWNAYNRVPVAVMVQDSSAQWSYTTASWRSANNSTSNRVSFIVGLNEDPVSASYSCRIDTTVVGDYARIGATLDATGAPLQSGLVFGNAAQIGATVGSLLNARPGLGLHFVQAVEIGNGTNAANFGDTSAGVTEMNLCFLGMF